MQIKEVFARKILNSKNEETIAVTVKTEKTFEASAPEGSSKGKHEVRAFSIRGIDFSVRVINALQKPIQQLNFETFEDLVKIEELVRKFDKTKDFSLIGGNALYALETAILKAMAFSQGKELWQFLAGEKKIEMPIPLGNCIGGGKHTEQELKTDFQEFLIMPETKNFSDAYFINLQAYKEAKALLKEKDKTWHNTLTYENALAATLDNEKVLEIMLEVRDKIKEKFNIKLKLGVDIAANSLWQAKYYKYKNFSEKKKQKALTNEEQKRYIEELIKKYNLFYVEDPFHEEAFDYFAALTRTTNCLVCGDDLTCTSLERAEKAIKLKAINAIIIKPNQVASLLETKKVIDLARKHDLIPIISHRSGETSDNALAHFAVGWQIPIIKAGILGKERFAKLHELLRIERKLG
ncbi:MAG: enolase C-terminal domain-like protein [Candidatus Pacearchaeota archaeon]